jgi:Arc/MetJ-type ribon-helix-helix transcriptional regulator
VARRKAVISAEPTVLEEIERLVRFGIYPDVSAFVREAMAEKLVKARRAFLREQVDTYCAFTKEDDGSDLAAAQAFEARDA